MTHIFRLHRLPDKIISKSNFLFTAKVCPDMATALNIYQNLSTAYHPKSDSQTEHVNAIFEQYLHTYCNFQQENCDDLLNSAQFCFINMQSSTTKHTPFFANYAFHPRCKI